MKTNSRSRKVINTPSVLGAIIDLGFCLDLLDTEYIKFVGESHSTLLESCKTLGLEMPVNRKVAGSSDFLLRNLDCAVIENLHLQRKENSLREFDSVRGVFVEGNPLYEGAGFHDKNHIQLCIRNPNCIKGYFIPRAMDNKFVVP